MRKNVQAVFTAWRRGQPLGGKSISTDGRRIFSYQTCIVQRQAYEEDALVLFNRTKYSATTSQQQGSLLYLIREQKSYSLRQVDNVPRGTTELVDPAV